MVYSYLLILELEVAIYKKFKEQEVGFPSIINMYFSVSVQNVFLLFYWLVYFLCCLH